MDEIEPSTSDESLQPKKNDEADGNVTEPFIVTFK
jgi:hypothetical protein